MGTFASHNCANELKKNEWVVLFDIFYDINSISVFNFIKSVDIFPKGSSFLKMENRINGDRNTWAMSWEGEKNV